MWRIRQVDSSKFDIAQGCSLAFSFGTHRWYHFGVGAPPILVYVSGDWDVHWGLGLLTHGQIPTHFRFELPFRVPKNDTLGSLYPYRQAPKARNEFSPRRL